MSFGGVGGWDDEVAVLMVGVEGVVEVEERDGVCTGEIFDVESGDDESVAVETVEDSDVVAVAVLEIESSA